MLGEHHHLANEFPEFRERIHELKLSDAHFAKLYEEYEELDKEIIRIEEEIETPSDAYTEELKKKRLLLKDELFSILKKS
jgi:hypothetical protein